MFSRSVVRKLDGCCRRMRSLTSGIIWPMVGAERLDCRRNIQFRGRRSGFPSNGGGSCRANRGNGGYDVEDGAKWVNMKGRGLGRG